MLHPLLLELWVLVLLLLQVVVHLLLLEVLHLLLLLLLLDALLLLLVLHLLRVQARGGDIKTLVNDGRDGLDFSAQLLLNLV